MSHRRLRLFAALATALIGSAAYAQTPVAAPFVGNWKLESKTQAGRPVQVRLELAADGSGKLQTYGMSRSNSCIGKAAPVAVEVNEPTHIKVRAKMSEVVQGCEDHVYFLTAGADGSLSGRRGSGAEVTVTKD